MSLFFIEVEETINLISDFEVCFQNFKTEGKLKKVDLFIMEEYFKIILKLFSFFCLNKFQPLLPLY